MEKYWGKESELTEKMKRKWPMEARERKLTEVILIN